MLHGLLIAKCGLSNDVYELMSSFLSDRYQTVKLSNNKSLWKIMLI